MASTDTRRSQVNPQNRRPGRELRPDEAFCWECGEYFLDGDLFERHRPYGKCKNPRDLDWVKDSQGAWGYRVSNRASSRRPRRTHAQAAFDRLVDKLSMKNRSNPDVLADIEKVARVLERDRDTPR